MMPSVLDERQNAASRARIIARLQGAGKATKTETTAQHSKPVVPKFVEAVGNGLTAPFIARAEALSCEFLAGRKVVDNNLLAKVLLSFFAARRDKKTTQKKSQKGSFAPLLFDAADRIFLERLGILKSLEGYCCPTEIREGVEGADFVATPFPAYALQRATSAIAETGTLVFANRTRAQAILTFLPTTHIVLLEEKSIVGSLEQAFARVKAGLWACHCVSGPSRTADIEQTLHMGAHGPKELCILLYN